MLRLLIQYNNADLTSVESIPISSLTGDTWHLLSNNIRLKAGDRIQPANEVQYRIIGVLVDEEDLFVAKLDVELGKLKVENEKFVTEATVLSARPHKLIVESSEDLITFEEDPTALVESTDESGKSIISVATEDLDKKFVRVRAQAIPLKH